ncbi:MAG TPA: hypothetical protein VNT22_06790 [Baekduia sp.]|nr:hypothetical protein [Baekduia sp.]
MALDILQIIGAVLILAAFVAAQADRLSQHSVTYLGLNVVGSLILAALALHTENWGFLLLEAVWTVVSAYGLALVLRKSSPPAAGGH